VSRADRWLAMGAPVVAMATVGVGLEIGGRDGVRAAVVYGAPEARGSSGAAWQVVVAEEKNGMREGLAGVPVEVAGRAGDHTATWHGATNRDGIAEAFLELPAADGVNLDVRSGAVVLAQGEADPGPGADPAKPSGAGGAWAPFARREGAVLLDVAVTGERVAPSFPATLWVHATDAATHAPVAGADVAPEADPSLTSATEHARTDSRGWAELVVVPAGLAVSLALDAQATDGANVRKGIWIGGLVASPGGARVVTRPRWSPDDTIDVAVSAPSTHSTAYVEIDDARGRAWATSVELTPTPGGPATGEAHAPKLGGGLYWAVASGDSAGAASLGAGTAAQPFFVARTDGEALALGTDDAACALPRDVRETSRAVGTCLALAVAAPVARWIALDGFAAQRARDAARRSRGLGVALGGVAAAVLLEVAILLRAAAASGAAVTAEGGIPVERRGFGVAVALLTGLLGFALLAAFLVRLS
jgi:hypothetical protein